ncbi:MAG: hypothetical protein QOJ72_475 [Nocardioidaceae bacterium]|nr:hypothetical protein [Nocardioidaceae bacterium]
MFASMTFDELRAAISGPVLERDDAGFEEEVSGFNLAVQQRPEVVVGVASTDDVVAAVRFAREHHLPVRVQATGHGVHHAITDGLLVSTRRLDSVSIDESSRIATIQAGTRWAAVISAADPHGLAPVTGSSTNVGVVGYLLGGGLGPLGRSHGFSSDYVRGYTVVTPTAEVVHASADDNADLFWALRGGKTGLGVVTEAQVELIPLPELYAGSLAFEGAAIEPAIRAWETFTRTAPDDVTTSVALFHFPPIDLIPEVFRGKDILMVRFARPGDAATGEQIAAPLRDAAPTLMDNLGSMARADVGLIHNDPAEPGPGWSRGAMLKGIDEEFLTVLLGQVGPGVRTPIMITEIRHLGARTAVQPDAGDSVGGRGAEFVVSMIGAPDPSLFADVLPSATDRLLEAIGPWLSPEINANFGDDASGQTWPGEVGRRLAAIRRAGDPDGIFVS